MIGRFNPPHMGHLEALSYILSAPDVSKVLLVIGSAQECFKLSNPFTAGERFEMLEAAVSESGVAGEAEYDIVPLPDINLYGQWAAYLKSMLPEFAFLYSNNPLVRLLIHHLSTVEWRPIPLKNRSQWSSTEVRRRIIEGEPWEELVPSAVGKLVHTYGGVQRLRELSSSDK